MNANTRDTRVKSELIAAATQTVRVNSEVESMVNQGLAAAFLVDKEAGAVIMLAAGVPSHVVARVLWKSERRASDWKHG